MLSLLRHGGNRNLEIKRLNRLRIAVSFAVVPVLLLVALLAARSEGSAVLARGLGALLLAAGVGVRFWALGSIDGNKKCVLVTWGAYSRLRHPLYLGSFLILLAFCVLAGSWTATALAGVTFLALYLPVIRAEERLLGAQYGEAWERYCRRSWAFLPQLWGRASMAATQDECPRPFRLLRPVRQVGLLIVILLGVYGVSEALRALRVNLDLPHLFF